MRHLKGFLVGLATSMLVGAVWAIDWLFASPGDELIVESGLAPAQTNPYAIVVVMMVGFVAGYAFVLGADRHRRIRTVAPATGPTKPPAESWPEPPLDRRPIGRGFTRRRRSKPLS